MSNFNQLISSLRLTSVTTNSALIFIPNTEVPWPMLQSSMPAYLNIHIRVGCSIAHRFMATEKAWESISAQVTKGIFPIVFTVDI